jgi:uncharacterized membrane protein HdeD (DUF308 family)
MGFVIAFTAPLHEDLIFNRSVFIGLCVGLVALGALGLARAKRADDSQFAPAAIGALTLIAAVVTLATSAASSFALILIVWAAATAVIEVVTGLRLHNRESITSGALAGVLAIALSVSSSDPVAAIGLLGAYGILVGVYLAIAACDFSPATGARPAIATLTDTPTPTLTDTEIAGSDS